jgi:hypothetical protein
MDIDARPSQWSDGREPAAGGLGGPLTEDASGRAGNEIGSSCPSASCVRLVAMTQMYCGPREESWGKSGITWGNTEGAGSLCGKPACAEAMKPPAHSRTLPGEAQRGPQLPRRGVLRARDREHPLKAGPGLRRVGRRPDEQRLILQPVQLRLREPLPARDAPASVVDGPQRRVNVATAKRPMSALRASLSRRFAVSLRGLW